MLPYGLEQALRVLVGAPLLLALPGALLLLPLAPRWGWMPRLTVGAALTMSAVPLAAWALNAWARVPFDAPHAWLVYAALLGASAITAALTRASWRPLATPRLRWGHAALVGAIAVSWLFLAGPRSHYFLPIHVDEWWPLAASKAMEAQATVDFVEPRLGLFHLTQNPEVGFHLLATTLRYLTGADWLALFYYGPFLLSGLLIATAYAAGEREGYGPEAALMVALLPTSVRLLGPQFFVPLAIGLLLIPASFLLFTASTPRRTIPLVALLLTFLFFTHPQSAAAAGILIGTYALLTMRKSVGRAVALLALAVAPFIVARFYFAKLTDPGDLLEAASTLSVPEFIGLFGLLPAILFLVGAYATFLRPSPERLAWIVTSAAHLALIGLFIVFGVGQGNLYDRAWMHGMLTMAMTAAFGIHTLRRAVPARVPRGPTVAFALAAVLLVGFAGPAQSARDADYYHVLSEKEVQDFAWIRENVPANGTRALLDPWEGTAFNALTGLPVYAAYPFGTGSPAYNASLRGGYNVANFATRVLNGDVKDERMLTTYKITLVYTHGSVNNTNYTQVHPDVYVRR